ncbi:hypothetical protein GOBAR_DD11205 [Gossypium barbadense]|nr:hypothetical protein GOBAR_DD11205 [Gossypium barbadense]
MASSEADSRLSQVVARTLEKIIKNASWRKHSKLAHQCKALLERLTSPSDSPLASPDSEPENSIPGPLHDGGAVEYSLFESEFILGPLINACATAFNKIVDPAVDCIQKLIAYGYLRGEADPSGGPEAQLLSKLIESVCKCHDLSDDAIELLVLKTLLSAVTSVSLRIHGDCLLQIVRTCYDIYLGSKNVVNQTTAKASLVQMLVIVFRRMEADSSAVPVQPIVVAELMEPIEKSDADGSMTQFVQGFITKIMQDIDGVLNPVTPSRVSLGGHDGAFETTAVETTNPADLLDSTDKDMLDAKYWEISMYKTALEGRKGELADALCKLSMKTPPKEALADPLLMRGKIVALELLKILLENSGTVFRTSERFLGAIKQYLCLSLLKNSASTLMIVFQLSCSIFISLVSRFRAGLKAEIGVFFPMIVLRVLENVAQPNFQQKMIVLRFLDKLCLDSQTLVDIFINYDCDVNSSNIFERMVNGLLKTAQGVPPGVATTLLPPQEATMKLEAMRCLVAILRSMGDWMNQQLRIPDPYSTKRFEDVENSPEPGNVPMAILRCSSVDRFLSVYYAATDVVILRFMIEVCWAPMLAAFSVPLDQSDDEAVITLCLEGFRYAIHVTAVMSMKTHRDAFVTSLAKFTSLHSPADIKQKNIYAIKAIVTIADEDGNYLREAWEHILTCVSRFEHLHLLGEGAPPDATFFAFPQDESEKSKQAKSTNLPVLNKKGPVKIQYAAASVMRGSYDGAGIGGNSAGAVTSEQVDNLVSNLNMLEQVGSSEMNRIFTRSQKLNSEAIIDFVKALCKVSMEELRSTSDPRVFSLTKIVEIAHYNMNRIRLVWSSIWHVLSNFFVTIGCSENLSIAIFAMDSLRQLSMKFLEREELANYNFQNEFMKPFVIVMRKSSAVEIRELIIRCVSQMVLSRVNNVKSGWKSMFMVFATAAYDNHKNIVLLAFEIMEKIIRDYFPYITETETTTFTDCVNCLVAFTNSRYNKDISLNAIAFLRFCAAKLAEGDLGSSSKKKEKENGKVSPSSPHKGKDGRQENGELIDKDDHLYFWFPLLAGLSELSFDPRPEIRKNALELLFETLRNHGHLFSLPLWERVFESVLFPIFDYVRHGIDPVGGDSNEEGIVSDMDELDQDAWLYETCTLALQLVVDLFVNFYNTVHPLLRKVLSLLISFIKRPHQSLAGIGTAAFVRLMSNAGDLFSEEKWLEVGYSLKEAANATLPDFSCVVSGDNMAGTNEHALNSQGNEASAGSDKSQGGSESLRTQHIYASLSEAKCRAAVQLLLIQAMMEIYNMYRTHLSAKNTLVLYEAIHDVASHAHRINIDSPLQSKLQEFSPMIQMQDPPLLRLENEAYQSCLTILQNLILDRPPRYEEVKVESHLVDLCQEVLLFYIETARSGQTSETSPEEQSQWLIPSVSGKRRELASRAPLIVATLQAICSLGDTLFEKNLVQFFPLLASLISCEHGSNEVQLSTIEDCKQPPFLARQRVQLFLHVDRCKRRPKHRRLPSSCDVITSSFATMELSNQFKQVFKVMDANGDGKISSLELRQVLLCLGHEKSTASKVAEGMIREMDFNGDGFIDSDEFMHAVVNTTSDGAISSCSSGDDDHLMDAFLIFDKDKNGFISAKELRNVLISLGFNKCSLKQCKRMIRGVDKDGDGFVDFKEFRLMMSAAERSS